MIFISKDTIYGRDIVNLFKKIYKKVTKYSNVNIIKSIYINGKYSNKNKWNNLLLYKKSIVQVEKGSSIDIKGKLKFNISRFKNNKEHGYLFLSNNSKLIVHGDFSICRGTDIFIGNNAILELGSGYIMDNLKIQCLKHIKIGNDAAISRDVVIRDSDSHDILDGKHIQTQAIEIGNHVWIGLNCMILKGVKIGSGSIIAGGAVVTKSCPPNSLIGGVPAKVLKTNVKWK